MDNVGIVVEEMDTVISFFTELGLDLAGRMTVEGEWAEGVTGLRDMDDVESLPVRSRDRGRPSLVQ